eukprot:TRINITY_DN1578_c0_g1_i1.p1 TRINITY_DN1578_c0_g1~~TRINITY_DN1578_c0_g1_i1.p1  ORF type:complete len:129 (+),score=22.74 TRINITY_DN1578_c0_g1_i1:337-723(+)
MSRVYYRNARAAVVCFDLTHAKSFEKVKFWTKELMENEKDCAIYVVGTKLDAISEKNVRATDPKAVSQYVESVHGHYFETSSKTGENVTELFALIAKNFAASPKPSSETKTLGDGVVLSPPSDSSCQC